MVSYSNREMILGLKNKNEKIIAYIYRKTYRMIEDLVMKNHGHPEDAEDVLQEALLIIYKKIKAEELSISCKFTTYLCAICSRLWLKELRNRRRGEIGYYDIDDYVEEIRFDSEIDKKKIKIYQKYLKKVGKNCQEILQLHFSGASVDEIMRIMGYENRQTVLDKKHRCKKRLVEQIINSPEFKELENELLITH